MGKEKDLSIELFDLTLPSPLIVAAGAPGTRSGEEIVQAAKAGAGAVITEGVGPEGCKTPRPWLTYSSGGLLNSTSFSGKTEQEWWKHDLPIAKKAGIPIIVGVDARFGIEAMQKTTRDATEAGADVLYIAANDPTTAPEHVKLIREETNRPIILKVGFHNAMEKIGKPIENAGVDGLIAIDGPWGMRVNVETGKPMVGGLAGIGHFCGPPIFPLAIYSVYLLARTVNIPVIGGGGLRHGRDLAEFMMVGAKAGSACTEIIMNGGLPRIRGILNEFTAVLDYHELETANDVIGLTQDFLKKRRPEELVMDAIPPNIDPQLCVACGQCVPSCAWNAITMDEVAEINKEDCVGCALCVSVCPYHAISLDYWEPVPSTHKPVNWK
jgi:dihydroorotate dehydrogenase/formate hydrogenlyase subunit 6/NADH:ubiquinone oxidoreductase subunit I